MSVKPRLLLLAFVLVPTTPPSKWRRMDKMYERKREPGRTIRRKQEGAGKWKKRRAVRQLSHWFVMRLKLSVTEDKRALNPAASHVKAT